MDGPDHLDVDDQRVDAAEHIRSDASQHRARVLTTASPWTSGRTPVSGVWIWADMPGVAADQVSVHLDDHTLLLEGRVSLDEYAGLTPAYTEYLVGDYTRRVHQPRHRPLRPESHHGPTRRTTWQTPHLGSRSRNHTAGCREAA